MLLQSPVLASRCRTSRVTRTMTLISGLHSVPATAAAARNISAVLVSCRPRPAVTSVSLLVGLREAQTASTFCSRESWLSFSWMMTRACACAAASKVFFGSAWRRA